jgi:hypothetical protein
MHWCMIDVPYLVQVVMYMFCTLMDGICLDDSTWIKVHHWYYLICNALDDMMRHLID